MTETLFTFQPTETNTQRLVTVLRRMPYRVVFLPDNADALAEDILRMLHEMPIEIKDLIRPCDLPYSHAQHTYGFICPGLPFDGEPGCICPDDDYSPACPLHSDHVYNPRTGEWILWRDLIRRDDADAHERTSVKLADREGYARGWDDAKEGLQFRPEG